MITAPVTLLRTPLRWAVNDSAPASMIQSNSTCQIRPEQGFGPVHPVRTVVRSPSTSPETLPSHTPTATAVFSNVRLSGAAALAGAANESPRDRRPAATRPTRVDINSRFELRTLITTFLSRRHRD